MKIALCLHGQLRDYDKSLDSWTAFIKKYKPDLYWHTWDDVPKYGIFQYNLIKGVTEKSTKYDYSGVTEWASTARNVGPQFESIHNVLSMIGQSHRGPYDFIVRARWDLVLHNPTTIDFELLNPNRYFVAGNHWAGNPDMIDDNIMIGSSPNIYCHNRIAWWLRSYWLSDRKLIPSGEQLISSYFKQNDLMKDVVKTEALNFTLARNL
jgi:hypothetical protein